MARKKQTAAAAYSAALEEYQTPEGILEQTVESVDAALEHEREVGTEVDPGAERAVAYERRRDGGIAHFLTQPPLPRELG